jgi:hypothetical protein
MTVNVSDVLPLRGIDAAPNPLLIVGGLSANAGLANPAMMSVAAIQTDSAQLNFRLISDLQVRPHRQMHRRQSPDIWTATQTIFRCHYSDAIPNANGIRQANLRQMEFQDDSGVCHHVLRFGHMHATTQCETQMMSSDHWRWSALGIWRLQPPMQPIVESASAFRPLPT